MNPIDAVGAELSVNLMSFPALSSPLLCSRFSELCSETRSTGQKGGRAADPPSAERDSLDASRSFSVFWSLYLIAVFFVLFPGSHF